MMSPVFYLPSNADVKKISDLLVSWLQDNLPADYHVFLEFSIPGEKQPDLLILSKYSAWYFEVKNRQFTKVKVNGPWFYRDQSGKECEFPVTYAAVRENPYQQAINTANGINRWMTSHAQEIFESNILLDEYRGIQQRPFPAVLLIDHSPELDAKENMELHKGCWLINGISDLPTRAFNRTWERNVPTRRKKVTLTLENITETAHLLSLTKVDEPIRFIQERRRSKYVAASTPKEISVSELVIDLFGGRVEILTDELLARPATSSRVQQFYSGVVPVDWDIIAADGDIQRDKQEEIIEEISKSTETLRLVCIVGQTAAGKSTLAWRVAAELHKRHQAFVIRIKDNSDPDVWFRLGDLYANTKRPFYVLVDDLFRDPHVVKAASELSPSLPISILATCRINEYRTHRVKAELIPVFLGKPSVEEKNRILQCLGKKDTDLTLRERRRLNAANEFLVLMIELTGGKGFQEIVRDMIALLQEMDESAYRAYEYVCFVSQYAISVPLSLLERLDAHGRFHGLLSRPATKGLMFPDEARPGTVRAGHPVIAETAYMFYEFLRAPAAVLQEIATALSASSPEERKFFGYLLRAVIRTHSSAVLAALPQITTVIAGCTSQAGVSELYRWWEFYHKLGEYDRADACIDDALKREPMNSFECNLLLNLYRERGRERDVIPVIAQWIQGHPDIPGPRVIYLSMIDRHGTREERNLAIEETKRWLTEHPDDTFVRASFLSVVPQEGTDIEETKRWLTEHPDDTLVRASFLSVVPQEGTDAEVDQIVEDFRRWLGLAEHAEDKHVRRVFLSWVGRAGNPEQVGKILRETSVWLAQHAQDMAVRTSYVKLLPLWESEQEVEQALQETFKWLTMNPNATSVYEVLIPTLLRLGKHDEATETVRAAIAQNRKDRNIVDQYLRLAGVMFNDEQTGELLKEMVDKYRKDHVMHDRYARWLLAKGNPEGAKTLLVSFIKRVPRSFQIHYSYGRLLLSLEEYDKASGQFLKTLKIHKGFQLAHEGLGRCLHGRGLKIRQEGRIKEAKSDFSDAEQKFNTAIYWAEINSEPKGRFYRRLGWLYIDWGRYRKAVDDFEAAIDEDPEYYRDYLGLGRALIGLHQFVPAANALRSALAKAPEGLKPPDSEEIPRLLKECLAQLGN